MEPRRILEVSALLAVGILSFEALRAQDYQFAHKRDPFVDLFQLQEKSKPKVHPPKVTQRPPGLAGLLISEVTVVGTAEKPGQSIVILKGTDNYTYVARPGSKLLDGFLDSVSTKEVAFVQELVSDSGVKISKKILKQYYTEAH